MVDWGGDLFASCCRGSNCSLAREMDGSISAAVPFGSCLSTATSDDYKARLVRFPVRRAI